MHGHQNNVPGFLKKKASKYSYLHFVARVGHSWQFHDSTIHVVNISFHSLEQRSRLYSLQFQIR